MCLKVLIRWKKPLGDVSGFVKFFIKIMNIDGIWLVGNTGGSFLLKNILANFFGAKSLISQNFLPARATLLSNSIATSLSWTLSPVKKSIHRLMKKNATFTPAGSRHLRKLQIQIILCRVHPIFWMITLMSMPRIKIVDSLMWTLPGSQSIVVLQHILWYFDE